MADGLYDDNDDELGRIGRPQPDAFPPVNLRGIKSASLNPKPMSEATPIGGSSTMPPGIPPGVMPTPKPVSPLTTRRGADEKELERLNTTGSGISQIGKAHPIAGGILRGLDTLGSIAVPGLMSRIPGTEIHHEALVNKAKGNVATDIAEQAKDATTEETQAKVPLTEAQTREANANAAEKENPQPKPKEEKWSEFAGFTDTDGTPLLREENSGQVVRASDKKQPTGFQATAKASTNTKEQLQQQIVTAMDKGDTVTVSQLQNKMRAIDPEGAERLAMAQAARQQAAATAAASGADRADKKRERMGKQVYGTDPKSGRTILTTEEDALNGGMMYAPAGAKEVQEDRMMLNRLSDVQQKIGRYENAVTKPLSEGDQYAISKILADDKFKAGIFGATLPVDFLNKLDTARNIKNISPEARTALIAYYNAREAMTGYNRVLTGSGRASDRTLQLQLETLPSLMYGPDFAKEAFSQFKENLGIVRQGLPEIPGVKNPADVEKELNDKREGGDLKPPKSADPGMKWQHRDNGGKVEWRQVPIG